MRSLVRGHTTLLAFSLCVATSTAFVACGSDESNGGGGDPEDGGTGGSVYSGGQTGGGGKVGTGGKVGGGGTSAGGTSAGGAGTGGSGTGGDIEDSGPDVISSNGDAEAGTETDAAGD